MNFLGKVKHFKRCFSLIRIYFLSFPCRFPISIMLLIVASYVCCAMVYDLRVLMYKQDEITVVMRLESTTYTSKSVKFRNIAIQLVLHHHVTFAMSLVVYFSPVVEKGFTPEISGLVQKMTKRFLISMIFKSHLRILWRRKLKK